MPTRALKNPEQNYPLSHFEEKWSEIDSGGIPAPYAGSAWAHHSPPRANIHQHLFYGASATLRLDVGDKLFTYVYLDPANLPTEIMLQWRDISGSWDHRAYWSADTPEAI